MSDDLLQGASALRIRIIARPLPPSMARLQSMKISTRQISITIAVFGAWAVTAAAETFSESFANPTMNTNLAVSASTNGFAFTLSGGQGVVSKQAGVGSGSVYVSSSF